MGSARTLAGRLPLGLTGWLLQEGWGADDQRAFDSLWAMDDTVGSRNGALVDARTSSQEGASSGSGMEGSEEGQPGNRMQPSAGRAAAIKVPPGPSSSNGSAPQRQRPPTVLVANKLDAAGDGLLPHLRLPPQVPRQYLPDWPAVSLRRAQGPAALSCPLHHLWCRTRLRARLLPAGARQVHSMPQHVCGHWAGAGHAEGCPSGSSWHASCQPGYVAPALLSHVL